VAQLAERRDDSGPALLHDERAGGQPDEADDDGNDARTDAGAAHFAVRAATVAATVVVATVAEHLVEARIEVAPHLVEVGRTVARTATVLGLAVIFWVAAPAWVVQRQFDAESF